MHGKRWLTYSGIVVSADVALPLGLSREHICRDVLSSPAEGFISMLTFPQVTVAPGPVSVADVFPASGEGDDAMAMHQFIFVIVSVPILNQSSDDAAAVRDIII